MAQRERLIKRVEVKREWLLRCHDSTTNLGVCAIGVSNGTLEVAGPDDEFCFALEFGQIAEFRAAFDAATARAEEDLRVQRAERLIR